MTIQRELIDELLTEYETPQDMLGEGGFHVSRVDTTTRSGKVRSVC